MKISRLYEKNPAEVEELLQLRGIERPVSFLHPREDMLCDPFCLDNMHFALSIVKECAMKKTLLVADSDCDGQCATAIMYNYLRKIYPLWEIEIFVHDGKQHGLEDVVKEKELSEYELVLLPDAGSNDDEYIKDYPYTLFVILDHHLRTVETPPPDNMVIVNNQLSEKYENKSLSGAGVTWQFCRAFDQKMCVHFADDFIDLAAVAIIGDIMKLTTEENRYITFKGLERFQNQFLLQLANKASFNMGSAITPIGVAFYIVPMINSMCRVGTHDEKIRMIKAFTNPSEQVASNKRGAAGTMIDVCTESVRECTNAKARQKRIQEKMSEICSRMIIENDLRQNKILVIVCDEQFDDIPSEMNGLAANSIANGNGMPTLIGRVNSDGYLRGSARGLATLDMPPLKSFLASSELFEYTEGHENAFGFSIKLNKLPRFLEWANEQLASVEMGTSTYAVDYYFDADNFYELEYTVFEVDAAKDCWGQGNPEPLFCAKDIIISRDQVRVCGSKTDTVQINYQGVTFMLFKQSVESIKRFTQYPRFKLTLVGRGNKNVWGSKVSAQIFIDDCEVTPYVPEF